MNRARSCLVALQLFFVSLEVLTSSLAWHDIIILGNTGSELHNYITYTYFFELPLVVVLLFKMARNLYKKVSICAVNVYLVFLITLLQPPHFWVTFNFWDWQLFRGGEVRSLVDLYPIAILGITALGCTIIAISLEVLQRKGDSADEKSL